ncbi:MAG: CapA family protein [Candidatus Gribaldobacteria bacterium]|nr:CapA family protein [Candidatus Gribaldobacteria bacterium]
MSVVALYGLVFFYYFNNHSFPDKTNFLAQIASLPQATSTDNQVVQDAPSNQASIIFTGDIMLSRGVAQKIKAKHDLNYPFLAVGDYLKSADLVFGNLETALLPGREIGLGEMVFRADPKLAKVLYDFNFAVVSLANNHTMNFGKVGLGQTLQNLLGEGVDYAGAGLSALEAYNPVVIHRNGLAFAFLAYTDNDVIPASYFATATTTGVAYMDIPKMQQAIKTARERADFVIVSMHAGNEYKSYPNTRQTNFARAAIDAGADLVIGHHPHVVQTAEQYKGKYIFYSLGNFIFDQAATQTKEGLTLKVFFTKDGIAKIEPQAVYIKDFSQPTLLSGPTADKIIDRLKISLDQL